MTNLSADFVILWEWEKWKEDTLVSLLEREMKVAEVETTLQQLPKVSASCFSHPLTKKESFCADNQSFHNIYYFHGWTLLPSPESTVLSETHH